jgi:hypothetical protein
MNRSKFRTPAQFSLADATRAQAAAYLNELCANDSNLLGKLDSWTQQRITEENMAKLTLVFESDDPAETCYRDLIREIDTEAEYGIYLAKADSSVRHLSRIVGEPGVSGRLSDHIEMIAECMFPDELAQSSDGLDLVQVTIQARHDRAHVDARVSEIIMTHLMDDLDAARYLSDALRSLQYAFHENVVRRCCDLNLLTDDRDERDLMIMVAELAKRCGSHEDRIAAICSRVNTA